MQSTLSEATALLSTAQSRFLASRTIDERARIFGLAHKTSIGLDRWAATFPLMRRVRVLPLALSVAAAAPYSTAQALISTASLSLWVFTLDDVFDEEHLSARELARRVDLYRCIARGLRVPDEDDQLAVALRDVREDLASYPLFAALEDTWQQALCGTIDAMLLENVWREGHRAGDLTTLPTYQEYLDSGLYSIGGPPHIWSAVITTGDPSTPNALEHLRKMERASATCIRLANDLRSSEKELHEEKINALVLLTRDGLSRGLPAQDAANEARARVESDIAQGLAHLSTLQHAAQTESKEPEATIADIARFVCDFYSTHDYHTFAAPVSAVVESDAR